MIYILHYVEKMNRGGMESFIMNLYRNIDRNKIQFHFIVHTNEKSDFDDEIEFLGGEIHRVPVKYRKQPIEYINFWKKFWSENSKKYAVFHFHTNSLGNITAVKEAKRNYVSQIIVHAHSTNANKGKLQFIHNIVHKINQQWISSNNIVKVGVSPEAGEWVFGKKAKFEVIDIGIDYNKFIYDPTLRIKLRKEMKLDNKKIIGNVGNFFAVKNHKFMIEILSELIRFDSDFFMVFLGDGILKQETEALVETKGLSDNVLFLGNVDKPEKYLNIMDIFLFPSRYEGLGMSMVEAELNSLPVVYNKELPKRAVISNSVMGLDLQSGANTWAKEINKLYNADIRGRDKDFNTRFDINNITLRFVEIYGKDSEH